MPEIHRDSRDVRSVWVAPRLTILARGSTEEHVLAACKTLDWVVYGPGNGYSECEVAKYCYESCEQLASS